MGKKNYKTNEHILNEHTTREEQRVWEYVKDKEIVDNELVKQIYPEFSENKRNKILCSLHKKGFLGRARKDLYYNPKELKSFYKVAFMINEGYLGLSSALRYYNLIEYEDFTIFVMTKGFQKKMDLKGTQYEIMFIPLKHLFMGFEKKDDMYISSIEKTLFDCFLKPNYIGFSNITKAIYEADTINWKKFIGFFKTANNNSLCQRTGYILELMKKETKLKVPNFVIEFLSKKVKNPVKLTPKKGRSTFIKKWGIQYNLGEKNILSWWY